MAWNVEIKARLSDINIQRNIALQLSESEPVLIQQEDVFFKTNKGRLKLRFFNERSGELISYDRTDKRGPKTSEYYIFKTDNPLELNAVLEHNMGILQKVKKRRELFIAGRTRIHIDQVDLLGDFLELEVVLNEGDSFEDGEKIANELMAKLQIPSNSLIDKAYVDLLIEKTNGLEE